MHRGWQRHARFFSIGAYRSRTLHPFVNPPPDTMSYPRHPESRLKAIMDHISYLSFQGTVRLAREAGVSHSAVSRMIHGKTAASFPVIVAITKALEKRLGYHIDPREILTFDGTYPTPSVCKLCGCKRCLPAAFYTKDDELKPEYRNVKSGTWSLTESAPKEGV